MSTLTKEENVILRKAFSKQVVPLTYKKDVVNSAAQAVETLISSTSTKNAISNAIDTATSPTVLTASEKKLIVAYVLKNKFIRDK